MYVEFDVVLLIGKKSVVFMGGQLENENMRGVARPGLTGKL